VEEREKNRLVTPGQIFRDSRRSPLPQCNGRAERGDWREIGAVRADLKMAEMAEVWGEG